MSDYYYTQKKEFKKEGTPKLKICGMNLNISEVASLTPDYLGFIFWEPSKRHFNSQMPELQHSIKKVGVFVNESLQEILYKIQEYNLLGVQLHGKESPEFCKELQEKAKGIEIIKVFSIKNEFNFEVLNDFEDVCDFFLFDTKGKLPGGNGYSFDWSVLENYPSTKPFFLSGGIGLEDAAKINAFLQTDASKYCYALDVNSKFEIEPGLKDIKKLKQFISRVQSK
ncbi:phosphoribosylanthranilate isomerase [uncultured Maribacter sp.]|uniref:phosphoribosylanthranilate isomerase n=1 Tax=uncultured Maribacter sp. TaxID=431308 RepID=UPI0026321955|nr:phosphoribosylanthranilate isomerase [uncultured Maribacter sp.]